MAGIKSFETLVDQYEQWFIEHPFAYVSEIHAIKELTPVGGDGIEIGVGTGRFAAPLGIKKGIEPAKAMAGVAKKRGVEVIPGVAENLPYPDTSMDFVLMVTTVCFLDDITLAFQEVNRILKPDGAFIIGFVDRESGLGREYLARKDKSAFYREAVFYSVDELLEHLTRAGFGRFAFRQTLFTMPGAMEAVDPVTEGHGSGGFVVIRGLKNPK